MKKKIICLLVAVLSISVLSGCSILEDARKEAIEQMEFNKEHNAGGDYYNEELADSVLDVLKGEDAENSNGEVDVYMYAVGEEIEFNSGIKISVTDWGTLYDSTYNKNFLYFDIEITNSGNETFKFNLSSCSVYADNYAVEINYVLRDAMSVITSIDPGRMASGRVYADVDHNMVRNLEVQIGNVVWVLKGDGLSQNSGEKIELSNHINANMNLTNMANALNYAGIHMEWLEDDEGTCYCVSSDGELTIVERHMGCEVSLFSSDSAKFSIYGLYCGMTLEQAEEVLNNYGAIDVTYEDDRGVRRYRLLDSYSVLLSLGEHSIDGISFSFYLDN